MPNQVLISHAQDLAERPSILNNLSRSRRDDLIVSFQLIDANERRGPGSQIIMNCEVGWHYGTYALSEIQSDNVRFLHRAYLAPQLVEFGRTFLSLPTYPPLLNPSNRLAASYREDMSPTKLGDNRILYLLATSGILRNAILCQSGAGRNGSTQRG